MSNAFPATQLQSTQLFENWKYKAHNCLKTEQRPWILLPTGNLYQVPSSVLSGSASGFTSTFKWLFSTTTLLLVAFLKAFAKVLCPEKNLYGWQVVLVKNQITKWLTLLKLSSSCELVWPCGKALDWWLVSQQTQVWFSLGLSFPSKLHHMLYQFMDSILWLCPPPPNIKMVHTFTHPNAQSFWRWLWLTV